MVMQVKDKGKIIEEATSLTKKYSLLTNIYRVLILAYLMKNGDASWTDLKSFIESLVGRPNPNTLHFHLYALVDAGVVEVYGDPEKPKYRLNSNKKDVLESVKPLLIYLSEER